MNRFSFLVSSVVAVSLWSLVGCGESGVKEKETSGTENGTDTDTVGKCAEGTMRCAAGQLAQKCVSGIWSDWEDCQTKGQRCELSQGVASCVDEAVTDESDTNTSTEAQTDTESVTNTGSSSGSDTGTESITNTGSESGSDTGTETDTWFDTDFDNPGCPDDQWSACYGNDVWCVDVGRDPVSLLHDCAAEEHCEPGTPATCECTPVYTSQCYAGDVWQYDSCAGLDGRLDKCELCETCVNTSGITAACQATTREEYQQCGADGNVRWFDSCDVEGEIVDDCDPQCNTDCEDTSPTTARCLKKDDFTHCTLVTEPDRSYDICIDGACQSPGCGTAVCNVPGPHFPLADTNQRECYDNSEAMDPWPSPGQDFYGQDAQYGWDVTHAATLRFTRSTATANQPVVTDNVTGLLWQGCAAGLSGNACPTGTASTATWADALAYCDSLAWGGYADWRLPDPYELASIVDSGRYGPAIDPAAFPGTPSAWFWSSSSYASTSGSAWVVLFDYGDVGGTGKNGGSLVRCVRSGPFESRQFEPSELSGDRMVKDSLTGLEWQGCAAGLSGASCATGSANRYIWSGALSYCEGLSYGGHTDWRLPSRAELQSIVDQRTYSPAIDAVAFPGTPSTFFPSSSSNVYFSNIAWHVGFSGGNVETVIAEDGSQVRCVRSGP